jgi:CheY-like chemotaxis protein
MNKKQLNILLADDDTDDCLFFEKALRELPVPTYFAAVHDGEQLMDCLNNAVTENVSQLPDVLFLDLNMPRKNGFECLSDMKQNIKLKDIPVVIFSTSHPQNLNYDKDMVNMLLKYGAVDFIRKPDGLEQLKLLIQQALDLVAEKITGNNK